MVVFLTLPGSHACRSAFKSTVPSFMWQAARAASRWSTEGLDGASHPATVPNPRHANTETDDKQRFCLMGTCRLRNLAFSRRYEPGPQRMQFFHNHAGGQRPRND